MASELGSGTGRILPGRVRAGKKVFQETRVAHLRLKVKVKVVQLCLTLCDPLDFTVHGIFQAKILEWVAYPFSSNSSRLRNQTEVCCVAGGFFISCPNREVLNWARVNRVEYSRWGIGEWKWEKNITCKLISESYISTIFLSSGLDMQLPTWQLHLDVK